MNSTDRKEKMRSRTDLENKHVKVLTTNNLYFDILCINFTV